MNELPDCKNCPLFTSTIVLHNLLLWLVMLTYTPAWFGAEPCSCFSFSNFCFTLLFPPRHCIGFLLQTKMSLIVQCVRRELITKSVFWEFTTHLWSISLVCYPLSSVLSLVVESWHLWALIFCFSSEPLNNIFKDSWSGHWIHWPATRDCYLFLSGGVGCDRAQKSKPTLARRRFFHRQDTWLVL